MKKQKVKNSNKILISFILTIITLVCLYYNINSTDKHTSIAYTQTHHFSNNIEENSENDNKVSIMEASSWIELKNIIDANKTEEINENNQTYNTSKLQIKLDNSNSWNANSNIEIDNYQDITLIADETITIYRDESLVSSSLFSVNGTLSLGTINMSGKIILDGNKENVSSNSCLVNIDIGTLNIYNNVILQNNKKIQDGLYKFGTAKDYGAKGSAIYANGGTINMYGGEIINNEVDTLSTIILNNQIIENYYSANSDGAGIYLCNKSTFNMYAGKINNNIAQNHSKYSILNTTYQEDVGGQFSAVIRGVRNFLHIFMS